MQIVTLSTCYAVGLSWPEACRTSTMACSSQDNNVFEGPILIIRIDLGDRSRKLKSEAGCVMRDDLLIYLYAVAGGASRIAQKLRITAKIIVPCIRISIDCQFYLIGGIPCTYQGNGKSNYNLIMIQRNASESFLNVISRHILTR